MLNKSREHGCHHHIKKEYSSFRTTSRGKVMKKLMGECTRIESAPADTHDYRTRLPYRVYTTYFHETYRYRLLQWQATDGPEF